MVRDEVARLVERVSRHGAHIVNSGEMIPRDTPEPNIRAFVDAARECYGKNGTESRE